MNTQNNIPLSVAEKIKEMRYYESILRLKTGLPVKVIEINDNQLGYMYNLTMAINFSHPMLGAEPQAKVFRKGLCAHELLHFLMDDLDFIEEMESKYQIKNKKLLQISCNLVMDAYNEGHPYPYIMGELRSALRTLRRHIYDVSPKIGNEPDPMTQVINAFIQLGDAGSVKGNFTFPEAQQCFMAAEQFFRYATEEEKRGERMRYTHLFYKELLKLVEQQGQQGSGDGQSQGQSGQNNSGSSQGNPSKGNQSGQNSPDNSSSKEGSSGGNSEEQSEGQSEGQSGEQSEGQSGANGGGQSSGGGGSEATNVEKILDDILDKLEKENRTAKSRGLSKEQRAQAKEQAKESTSEEIEYYGVSGIPDMSKLDSYYEELKREVARETSLFKKGLENLFKTDKTREIISSKGRKLDLKQVQKPIPTDRLFRKKLKPKGIDDVEVYLCIDCSGSMDSSRTADVPYWVTRRLSCVINEAMARLDRRVYVHGFDHNEVVSFNNGSLYGRIKTMYLGAYGGTSDAKAINKMAEIMKKSPAKHKIMFVLSDGCGDYIEEVLAALKEAKKYADVIGVSIGDFDHKYMVKLYGDNLVEYQSDFNQMVTELPRKLKSIVKRWKK